MRDSKHKSSGVSPGGDVRTERTRAAIATAFAQLLRSRPYARIRVSDITRKARVGRATYYAHFATKDALLGAQLDRFLSALLKPLEADPCLVDATALFAHVQQVRPIFRSLCLGPTRQASVGLVQDAMEARIAALATGRVCTDGPGALAAAFVPRFVAGTMLALIEWSLEEEPAPPPEDLQSAFRALVGRALAPIRPA